jgi:hypothetical protein
MKKYIITALFCLLPLSAHAQLSLGSGLVGYWPLDTRDYNTTTSVIDRSGNGNTGTLTPNTNNQFTSTSTVAGKLGQALKFNGTNSYANITMNSKLPIYSTTTPYSISFWMKTSSFNSGQVMYNESGGNSQYFYITLDSTKKVQLNLKNDAGTKLLNGVTGNTALAAGVWNHIVWTDNVGTAALYINGVKDTANFNYTPAATTLTTTRIGNIYSNYYNGSLDDVRVYNRALSASEVKQLYRQSAGVHSDSFLDTIMGMIGGIL